MNNVTEQLTYRENDYPLVEPFRRRSIGIIVLTAKGIISKVNDSFLHFLGKTRPEVCGQHVNFLLNMVINRKQQRSIKSWLREPTELEGYVVYLRNARNEFVIVNVSVVIINDAIIIIAEPMEECILPAANHSVNSSIIDLLPMPAIGLDQWGKVNLFNQAAEDLFKLKASSLMGKEAIHLKHHLPYVFDLLMQTLEYDTALTGTPLIVTNAAGDVSNLVIDTRRVFDAGGCLQGALAFIQDVSNYALMQRQILKRARFDFISNLAEEAADKVRNPLTSIKGFIQLYQDSPGKIPWELINEGVSDIEKAISDFLVLSQNYGGKPDVIDINDVVKEVYYEIEMRAQKQGVWIELYLGENKMNISACYKKIKKLVANLIINSLKNLPNGGFLTIQTLNKDKSIRLIVADSRIPLKGAGSASRPLHKQHTLELAMCEHILEGFNGSLILKPQNTEGTVIIATIPMCPS